MLCVEKKRVMLRRSSQKIRTIKYAIYSFKNWRELIFPILKGEKLKKIILRNGILIEAPENNTLIEMTNEIFNENVYTPSDFQIETDDIVLDIGANIGIFTLYAATKTQGTIYAFEPFPENVEFLNKNIEVNGFHNVIVQNLAVNDKIGTEKLFLSEISGGHLLFDHNIKGEINNYVEILTTTLDHIVEENSIEQIDFLKLDCEGSEGQILMSTSKNPFKKIRKIAMEFHDNVSMLNHNEIFKLLENEGFSCKLNWDGKSPFGYLYAKRN